MPRRSKAYKESWQRDIDREFAKRKPRVVVNSNKKLGATRTITERLQDLRNRDRLAKQSKKEIEEAKARKKGNDEKKTTFLPQVSLSLEERSQVPTLTRLAARVFLLDIKLYIEYEDIFFGLPAHIKQILLEEAVVVSRLHRTKIINNEVTRMLLSKCFQTLTLSCSEITDDIVHYLAPKFECGLTEEPDMKNEYLDANNESKPDPISNACDSKSDPHESQQSWEMVAESDSWRVKGLAELTALDVSFCSEISDEFVRSISEELPRLRKLNLSGNFLSDNDTGQLALQSLVNFSKPVFCALVELNLSYCDWLSPGVLEYSGVISRTDTTHLPLLKILKLEKCSQLASVADEDLDKEAKLLRSNFNPNHSQNETYVGFEEIGSLLWHFRCDVDRIKEWQPRERTFEDYYVINAKGCKRKLKLKM